MGRTVGTPSDQTATASSSTSSAVTDVCLPTPVSGTSSSVVLSVTYSLTADGGATARVDYSTDAGVNWTTLVSVSAGSDSGTETKYLGSVDKGNVQVRAWARGHTGLGATATSNITAWNMSYLDNPRIFRID